VTVHAFEMRPDRFRELKANAASDAAGERISAHLAGVTEAHAGEREVWLARGMLFEERPQPSEYREAWWRRVKFALRGNKGRDLERSRLLITSIDHFAEERHVRPDVLKIDVEGYEGRVLRGARRTLAEHRPFVLLELHKDKKLRFGAHREDVAQVLFDLGYQGLFFTNHQKRRACDVVETGRGCPLLRRQETDLILFFHPHYRGGAGASPLR
jgi:FkbM family methyltransferase